MYLQQQIAIHNNVIDVGTSHCLKCHCAVTYTIQACDCTHYAVGCVLLLLTNFFGMRYHSGVLWGPRPASWDQQLKQCYKNLSIYTSLCEMLMMVMFELLMQTGVIIHTHNIICTHTRTCTIMLFGFMFLPIGFMMAVVNFHHAYS